MCICVCLGRKSTSTSQTLRSHMRPACVHVLQTQWDSYKSGGCLIGFEFLLTDSICFRFWWAPKDCSKIGSSVRKSARLRLLADTCRVAEPKHCSYKRKIRKQRQLACCSKMENVNRTHPPQNPAQLPRQAHISHKPDINPI